MARQRARDRRPRKRVDDPVTLDKEYVKQMEAVEKKEESSDSESVAPPPDADEKTPEPEAEVSHTEPDEGAKVFGERGKAWMTVEIAEDKQQATLTALNFAGETVKAQAVVDAIREIYQIQHGFKKKPLKEAIKKAKKEGEVRGSFVIAKSKDPEPGADGSVELLFQETGQADAALPYQAVKEALAKEALDAVLEKEVVSVLVAPGEALARVVPPTEGKPGKDIFGTPIEQPGKEAQLTAGSNVTSSEGQFESQYYGYACVIKDEISVLPPFWIAPEFDKAHFIHFPQARKAPLPQRDWIESAASLAGIAGGLDEEAVDKLCAKRTPATEKVAIRIASSMPPVHGKDAHVKYTFDPTKRVGNVLEDGTIDYRERNAAIGVSEGAVIGELVAATPGESGRNVKGDDIPATPGEERTFTAGQNVRSEAKDGGTSFVAEIDGAVNVAGGTIEVQPVFAVNGDVDYDSGNIDLPINVDIGGSVISGFSVKSGGSVTVGGSIENGAPVQAKGDVIVAKGIFGDDTKVVALGNVEAKFIQNSTVMAHENVTAGAYIINGIVRAGGEVKVEEGGGSSGGSIISGEVVAGKRVEAKRLGSHDTDRTVVGISGSAEQLERLGELERTIKVAELEMPQLVRNLGLSRADIGEVQAQLDRATERRRKDLKEPSRRLVELIRSHEQALDEKTQLAVRIAGSIARGTIAASDTVYADVYIQFGAEVSRVSGDIKAAEFHYKDGVHWRPLDPDAGEATGNETTE